MFVLSIRSNVSTQQSLLKISSESVGIPSFIGNELTPGASNCVSIMKEIKLNHGKVALVDDVDFEYLNQWKWSAHKGGKTFYAERKDGRNGKCYSMHRVILGLTDPKIFGDHEDHNGLNNQRSNLKIATRGQNGSNRSPKVNGTSKFLGVHLHKAKRGRPYWHSQIKTNGIKKSLGYFRNELDAALAYDSAAKEYHGEFANLNFK